MILEVPNKKDQAVFRQELFRTLSHYYEDILSMPCAGGRPQPKHFNHVITEDEKTYGGDTSGEPGPPALVTAAASGAVLQATAGDAAEGAAAVTNPNPPPALAVAVDV